MDTFPEFMKHPANRIVTSNQATPGVEGYVFDGVDGSRIAFWTCRETAASATHAHDYDEYMIVVQGCYTLIINGERIPVKAGEEYLIAVCRTAARSLLRPERSTHSAAAGPTGLRSLTHNSQLRHGRRLFHNRIGEELLVIRSRSHGAPT
jgi:hypothetical protein